MRPLDDLLRALKNSPFRTHQVLAARDRAYLQDRGLDAVLQHASDFIAKRLAPAEPVKDGKQTPWRGHPVFTAQHATATCCRSCLQKWHYIEPGRPLTGEEQQYIVDVLRSWLGRHVDAVPASR
jgi:uncharacterized protein DUF4186